MPIRLRTRIGQFGPGRAAAWGRGRAACCSLSRALRPMLEVYLVRHPAGVGGGGPIAISSGEMAYPRDGMIANAPSMARPRTHLTVLIILSLAHLLNDPIQSLIPAVYPIIKDLALDFAQIGMITLTFQIAGSLFQPAIGSYTERHPLPYSAVVGMVFSLVGLVSLAFASGYALILVSVALIGIGSSIFHPEATRSARYASGAGKA